MMTAYNQLLIMSLVAGGLYLLLKLLSALTSRYFTAAWHYYSNLIMFSFFLIPYYKILSLFHVDMGTIAPNGLRLPSLMELNQPTVINPANTALMLQTKAYAGTFLYFVPYIIMAGTLIFLAAAGIQGWRLRRCLLNTCAITTEEQVLGTLLKCRQELGIAREIPVYRCAHASTPFLYGNWRPRIIVPDLKFTADEWRYIFLHELRHWKRHDAWLKGVLLLINALHWFNPLAYLARGDLDRFGELSCDEGVVQALNAQERREYCELILSVAGSVIDRKNRLASVFAFNNKQNLERRIRMILNSEGLKHKKPVRMVAIALTLAVALLGASVAAYAANEQSAPASQAEVMPATAGAAVILSSLPANGLNRPHPEVSISNAISADSVASPGTGRVAEPMTTGSLSPGASTKFDKQTIGAGSVVTIAATWTPASANLEAGLYSYASGTTYYKTLSGGSGSAKFNVSTTGEYAIYIGNPSPSTVRFSVSYIVN